MQTRRGALVQDHFPDLAAAARRSLPNGLVLDGELAVLDHHGQLSFTALQRRATASRNPKAPAAEMPAHFITFDVLQNEGQLALFAGHRLGPPSTLGPSTTAPATAGEWLCEWTDVPGIEGVVVKSLTGQYRPGVRGWTKVRRRNTTEALIGAVTGSRHHPQTLLLGRYDTTGRLRLVGKTILLIPGPARELADHHTAAGPANTEQDHGVWRPPSASSGSAWTPPTRTSPEPRRSGGLPGSPRPCTDPVRPDQGHYGSAVSNLAPASSPTANPRSPRRT